MPRCDCPLHRGWQPLFTLSWPISFVLNTSWDKGTVLQSRGSKESHGIDFYCASIDLPITLFVFRLEKKIQKSKVKTLISQYTADNWASKNCNKVFQLAVFIGVSVRSSRNFPSSSATTRKYDLCHTILLTVLYVSAAQSYGSKNIQSGPVMWLWQPTLEELRWWIA